MAYTITQARKLLTTGELSVFESSRPQPLRALTPARLRSKLERARTLRDKYRDLYRRQTVATRGAPARTRSPVGADNQRTKQKAELFAEVLARYETEQKRVDAAAKVAAKAAAKAAKEAAKAAKAAEKASASAKKAGTASRGGKKAAAGAGDAVAKKVGAGKGASVVKKASARKRPAVDKAPVADKSPAPDEALAIDASAGASASTSTSAQEVATVDPRSSAKEGASVGLSATGTGETTTGKPVKASRSSRSSKAAKAAPPAGTVEATPVVAPKAGRKISLKSAVADALEKKNEAEARKVDAPRKRSPKAPASQQPSVVAEATAPVDVTPEAKRRNPLRKDAGNQAVHAHQRSQQRRVQARRDSR